MSLHSMFATDPTLEKDGVWTVYDDFRVRIARAGGANRKYQLAFQAKMKPHERSMQLGVISEDVSEKLMHDLYAETIVTGWQTKREGKWEDVIEVEPGVFEPVSKAALTKVFKAYPDIFADIMRLAGQIAAYREEILELNAKN